MRWLAVGILFVLLAGCGGKSSSGAGEVRLGDGQRISLDVPEDQQPNPDDIRGVVSGVVVDDAIYPVAGATVRILKLEIVATTDDAGLFIFEGVPPGLHAVEASKEGHAVGLGTLNVRSGQVAKAVLMAPRLPYREPYHTTHVFEEFRSAQDALNTARYHLVALDPGPTALIVESYWEALQAPPLGDPLSYRISGESNESSLQQGTGANPFRVELGPDWFPKDEYAVRVQVTPATVSLPPDVTGRTYVTAFYVDPPMPGWSFVAGDP
ncbi:MAG: carboxypeptidase-like regulatory domain-containing protein [Candidatus Thermoplasmatota archaeon]